VVVAGVGFGRYHEFGFGREGDREGIYVCLKPRAWADRKPRERPVTPPADKGGKMLKTIDPLLNADVLYALRAMGHGDRLVICDTNFPADSIARQTALGRLLRIDNVTAARAVAAVLSVLPLDTFVDDAAIRMEVVGQPKEVPAVQQEVQAAIDRAEGRSWPCVGVERHAFYEKAKTAYCVIATGERRFYGCFLFTKGVIPPDDER
jgi:L-fucose mutarotase